ncbi:signal peptidase subunit [Multifurca ochricompacta]|uniref:Signal peptidase subunit 3 n=1 Tax=Multifurca ochricompacta TaxID=376703 RepID=A0AAD4M3R0_9AGAM|nr:signal peptidase subunit [Multifurca ochricompacta]
MHSIYARINNVSATLSTTIMVLLTAIALSSFIFTGGPTGSVEVTSVKVFSGEARRYPHRRQEYAFVNFNITADLTPLFNWNTKQLFVYLEAEYTNAKGVRNEVVFWDRIVRRKEDAVIAVSGKNKYPFREVSAKFKNSTPANYTLKYNLMPFVGMLTYGEAARVTEPIDFPLARERVE